MRDSTKYLGTVVTLREKGEADVEGYFGTAVGSSGDFHLENWNSSGEWERVEGDLVARAWGGRAGKVEARANSNSSSPRFAGIPVLA